MGSKRDDNYRIMSKPKWVLWFIYQSWVTVMMICLFMLPFIIYADIGSLEETWTDFSPEPAMHLIEGGVGDPSTDIVKEEKLDKEKYRVYFEDRELVLMVLGGIEWWYSNCGTLSGPGNYFMSAAITKHKISKEEMAESLIFQTGHFAAALYNDCDVFLEQTKTIGLDIMLEKTPKLELETVDNLSDSEA